MTLTLGHGDNAHRLRLEVVVVRLVAIVDDDADLSYLDDAERYKGSDDAERYMEEDAARLKDYGSTWDCVGLRAIAETQFVSDDGTILDGPDVESAGLWGIEDTWGETDTFWAWVWADEYADLLDQLAAMGVSMSHMARVPVKVDGRVN